MEYVNFWQIIVIFIKKLKKFSKFIPLFTQKTKNFVLFSKRQISLNNWGGTKANIVNIQKTDWEIWHLLFRLFWEEFIMIVFYLRI